MATAASFSGYFVSDATTAQAKELAAHIAANSNEGDSSLSKKVIRARSIKALEELANRTMNHPAERVTAEAVFGVYSDLSSAKALNNTNTPASVKELQELANTYLAK